MQRSHPQTFIGWVGKTPWVIQYRYMPLSSSRFKITVGSRESVLSARNCTNGWKLDLSSKPLEFLGSTRLYPKTTPRKPLVFVWISKSQVTNRQSPSAQAIFHSKYYIVGVLTKWHFWGLALTKIGKNGHRLFCSMSQSPLIKPLPHPQSSGHYKITQ